MSIDWDKASRFAAPEQSAGYLLWHVTHRWQRQVEATLVDLEITHLQFVLLAGVGWLSRAGDLPSQVDLAEFCQVDRMQISQVVRKLEMKGLLKRDVHPTDTRVRMLKLTAMGETILSQALPLIEQLDSTFFSACQPAVLLAELQKLQDNL